MNKKALLLLFPLLAMSLTGCKQKATDDEEEEEVIPEFDPAIYGTEQNPLTIAQLSANVASVVAKEAGIFSYYKFYARGLVDATATATSGSGGKSWASFYLKDSLSGKQNGFRSQRTVDGTDAGLKDVLCKGDSILISGYAEYYNGAYSLFPKNDIAPEVLECTRGTSTFTVENSSTDITYPEVFQSSYKNMTNLTITPTTERANYSVVVKVNGGVLTPPETGNTYSITVKGDTTVSLSLEWKGDRQNIPAGEYKLKITDANSQLGTAPGTGDSKVYFNLGDYADDPSTDTFYNRVTATFSKQCYNHPTTSYHEINFDANGKVVFEVPQKGYVKKVDVCTYKYTNIGVYKGNSTSGTNAIAQTGNTDNVPGYSEQQDPHLLSYDVVDPSYEITNKVTINATNSKSISLHYIEITVVIPTPSE